MHTASDTGIHRVLGAWQAVSFTAEGPDGTEYPLGRPVQGLLIYTVDGQMSVHLSGPGGYIGYAGTYQWLGDRVVHRTLLGTPPEWAGAEFLRWVTLTDNQLVLRTPPDPNGTVLTVVWHRPPGLESNR
ncbi:lipocalin-like domain-containing protein [Streptomyces sp. ICN441]|uniref:lipocalin-like domain-containing protein n=1 Tax=Streptomyces sp. ICN441 TaxID=2558286 RepID=UPI001F118EE5|nr:lipocalin-like domain-containing protein [Streptomyces sp. ICN441]